MSALIAHGKVNAISLGFLHVLILAHSDGVVFRNQISWRILGGNGDEGDHIFHLIIIGGESQGQMSYGVFSTYAKIVRRLSLQVGITQIEIDPIHILHILIVQFLGSRGLITLTPGSPQSQLT